MKAHWSYLKYVCRHKWFVFLACLELKVSLWQALVHDWTKFLPREWSAYVHSFYNRDGSNRKFSDTTIAEKDAFAEAWNHHQKHNRHHWQYWVLINDSDSPKIRPLRMPDRYLREMIADWIGAGRAITGKYEVVQWYAKNREQILLEKATRIRVEHLLKEWAENRGLSTTALGIAALA